MRLFDITEARYFCQPLPAHTPGQGQSLATFHKNLRVTRLVEGQLHFNVHRVSLLNAVERWILFGVADYRRALDMFIPSNAPWAQVTLYYSSFFAANAILGMFGVWVGLGRFIDVESGTPTQQVLRVARKVTSPSGLQGSHQVFWDLFYEGCNTIGPWAPPHLQTVVAPVNNDRAWQIKARNDINYDMAAAFDGAVLMHTAFDARRFRDFGGVLGQQLEVTEGLLKLALYFANDFGISSFAYNGLSESERPKALRALVTKVPPGVVTQSVLQELFQ